MGRKGKVITPEQMREALLEVAKKKGLLEDCLFKDTLRGYDVQLKIMERLEEQIENAEIIVTKKYGTKENEYINPAISEYNKTRSAANGTVATLLKILSNSGASSEDSQPGADIKEFCGL